MKVVLDINNTEGIRLSPLHTHYNPQLFWWEGIQIPAPIQHGVLPPNENMKEPWVVHVPQGRWSTRQRIPICPLEHPVDLPREHSVSILRTVREEHPEYPDPDYGF